MTPSTVFAAVMLAVVVFLATALCFAVFLLDCARMCASYRETFDSEAARDIA